MSGPEDDESEIESLKAPVNFKSFLKCTCGQPSNPQNTQCLRHYGSRSLAKLHKISMKNTQS